MRDNPSAAGQTLCCLSPPLGLAPTPACSLQRRACSRCQARGPPAAAARQAPPPPALRLRHRRKPQAGAGAHSCTSRGHARRCATPPPSSRRRRWWPPPRPCPVRKCVCCAQLRSRPTFWTSLSAKATTPALCCRHPLSAAALRAAGWGHGAVARVRCRRCLCSTWQCPRCAELGDNRRFLNAMAFGKAGAPHAGAPSSAGKAVHSTVHPPRPATLRTRRRRTAASAPALLCSHPAAEPPPSRGPAGARPAIHAGRPCLRLRARQQVSTGCYPHRAARCASLQPAATA
jgi:hypothetical protein